MQVEIRDICLLSEWVVLLPRPPLSLSEKTVKPKEIEIDFKSFLQFKDLNLAQFLIT